MSSVKTPPDLMGRSANEVSREGGVHTLPFGSRLVSLLWPGPAVFVLLWLGLSAGGSRFLRDPGTFWHTVVGEKILTEGFFDTDPFTFSHAGEKWIPHQWLGEVAMALAHRVGGFDALLVGSTAVVAALYAWLAARFIRTGLHPIFTCGVTLLAIAAAATHFHVRPHLFTMIGMAATMHAVIEFENRRVGWRRLLWLIPLYLVWTNTHGGMLGGLTTLAMAGVGWVIWPPSPPAGEGLGVRGRLRILSPLALIALACGLTAFVTPYGPEIARTWLYINNGMSRLPEIIAEHARLDFTDPKAWPLLALAIVYLTLLAGVLPRRPKMVWLIPLFWLAQALLRVRHGALFAPVAVLAMIDLWPHTRYARWLAAMRPDVYTPPVGAPVNSFLPVLVTATLGVAVALGCQWLGRPAPLVGPGTAKFDPMLWPTDLLDDLKRLEPKSPGEPNHIFCEYIYGGFLIYHTPGYKVFVDDRCELFGDDWLIEYVNADSEDTAGAMARWQEQFGRFDFALTTTTDRDAGYDWFFRTSGEWEVVRRTDTATLYRRK
jgi:hypothetical protein